MKKVSIVVPVYKSEAFLPKLIDSVLGQSYTNFELILVDDESPDNSGKICDDYAQKDKRILVIHKKNGGCCDARNKGLEVATGEYLMLADGDDWLETAEAPAGSGIQSRVCGPACPAGCRVQRASPGDSQQAAADCGDYSGNR